jgi:hypothetical protein
VPTGSDGNDTVESQHDNPERSGHQSERTRRLVWKVLA